MDASIHMAESLCCAPETMTAIFNYNLFDEYDNPRYTSNNV